MSKIAISLPIVLICAVALTAMKSSNRGVDQVGKNPEELGTVRWMRDLDEAIKVAKKKKRDIFLLFQEVPG